MKRFIVAILMVMSFLLMQQTAFAAPVINKNDINSYYDNLKNKDISPFTLPGEKIDLLLVVAHPDDDMIFMGGTLPYYSAEFSKNVLTVYMTMPSQLRKTEALNGLSTVKNFNYPLFASFPDKLTHNLDDAKKYWKQEQVIKFLVSVMEKYSPEVVVTHDLNGEYGHGAHMLTAESVLLAADKLNNPPKKVYLHLYPENEITMDWNIPLSAFNGKTALDMAKEGYNCHESQHKYNYSVTDTGKLSNARFGLARTTVGEDIFKNDFFENICQTFEEEDICETTTVPQATAEASQVQATPAPSVQSTPVAATSLPSAAPANTSVAEDTSAKDTQSKSLNIAMFIVIGVFAVCVLGLVYAIAKYRKNKSKKNK